MVRERSVLQTSSCHDMKTSTVVVLCGPSQYTGGRRTAEGLATHMKRIELRGLSPPPPPVVEAQGTGPDSMMAWLKPPKGGRALIEVAFL